MKTLLFTVFTIASFVSFSQTKWINHKSHSGSKATFAKGKATHGNTKSNFGLPDNITFTVLDTIRVISNTELELIYRRSKSCHSPLVKITDLKAEDFERLTLRVDKLEGVSVKLTPIELLNIVNTSSEQRIWFKHAADDVKVVGPNNK